MAKQRESDHRTDRSEPSDGLASAQRPEYDASELLPVVYAELRHLARSRMRQIPPGQTLDPTALVHEAWVRISHRKPDGWSGRAEFFHAAARAMRDILVEDARRKGSLKRGGDRRRLALADHLKMAIEPPSEDLLALDEAIADLAGSHPEAARVTNLRYFVGLTTEEVAAVEGVSVSTVERLWRFARAWLKDRVSVGETDRSGPSRG
ncbi:MAG: ECF-type sigma factor [Phycisphaerales bacterium JB065]